ncbi:right-handed parallel beta-helix repeat-containing protein [Streptomyces sp. NPDC050844]|uniref:right-handed parallel beta-helix repeat-containing protein n=1 Tax=Streptomyces sp. NPDC050844 TaxID=3155790 RepID=UPI00341058A5
MALRRTSTVALTALALAGATAAPTAAAEAKTYYVDCRRGSDNASGTSAGTAWRSLQKASAHTYAPGEKLLLRRGTSCTGVLAPKGAGAAGAPVLIDAYGSGKAKPRIQANGARAALHLINTEQWEIRNLDLSNTGPATTTERRAGLYVQLTDYGTADHFVVDGVDVHDVNGADFKDPDPSGGILFVVQGSTTPTRFNDLRVEDSTVRHVDRTGIGTMSTWGSGTDADAELLSSGVEFVRNKAYDVGGDGIVIHETRKARVEHNYVDGFNMRSAGYNAGIWAWESQDALYQYNEVTGGHGTRDSMAYDIDGGNVRNTYRYNYSHDNEGGFLLVCNATDKTSDANRIHDNISVNDRNTTSPYAVISVVCGAATDTQVYRNTVVTDRADTALVSNNGPTGVTFRDNVFVGAPGAGSPIKDTVSTFSNNLYWRTAQPRDASGVNADPRFTDSTPDAPDDVRLRSDSPARGIGTAVDDGTTHDYFGNPIPDPPNLGADQGS